MGLEVPIFPLVGLDNFCLLIGPCGVRLWDLWGGARRTLSLGRNGWLHSPALISEITGVRNSPQVYVCLQGRCAEMASAQAHQ